MKKIIHSIRSWYVKYERHLSSFSLIAGFIFDAVTLKRVDLFLENFWVGMHLLMAAVGIVMLNLYEKYQNKKGGVKEDDKDSVQKIKNKDDKESRFDWWHAFLIVIIQFAFGGLFSTFIVFYFRSATLSTAWPFMLLLAFLLAGNELLKKHYSRLTFQISVFFVAIFSFAIFVVPVAMHRIGNDVFIISGLVSLATIWVFIMILRFTTREKFIKSRGPLFVAIFGLYAVINILYFSNLIPPIPLSLKDAGVYHSIVRNADGNYSVESEQDSSAKFFENLISPILAQAGQSEATSRIANDMDYALVSFKNFFRVYGQVHVSSSDPVYAYSAIFSPPQFNTQVVHVWQHFQPDKADRAVLSQNQNSNVQDLKSATSTGQGLWSTVKDWTYDLFGIQKVSGKWITMANITINIVGGREGGFRTFSSVASLEPGLWRVIVRTPKGQEIGRIKFEIVSDSSQPVLVTDIKQ